MESTKQMFYFAVGDVVAKRDLLGLFSQSDYVYAEELYDAYGEQISQLTEKICRDDGWKDIHWTKILQALKEVFGTDGGRTPPALQREMEATAQEIQAAIFQSPAYRPELLQCGEAEKEECLKTVVCLYRLRDLIRRHGYLDLFVPNAPLLDACFDFPEHDIDAIWRIKKIFRQCMATEGFSGGKFLNNAVAAEGILLYLRFPEKSCSRHRAQWGQKLCGAVKGLFGPDFKSQVEACIERETKEHENGFPQDEEIPFASLSIDWPKTEAESGKVKEEKEEALKIAAKIFRMDLEAAGGDVKWEDAALDFGECGEDSLKGRIIAEGLACLRRPGDIERFFCTAVKSMLGLEYVKRVDQAFKEERKAYRKRRNKKEPSIVPEFDDLAKLSPEECALVLAKIPENTLVYAFKGAGDKAEDLLWRSLPEKTRQEVEEDLDIVVNVRLKDVEEAQRVILEKARQMFGEKCLSDCGEDENV